jgi:methyl coenzyme M reductase subunit D
MAQPQKASAVKMPALLRFLFANTVESFVGELHDIETVKRHMRIGQYFTYPVNECGQHIHTDFPDPFWISTVLM